MSIIDGLKVSIFGFAIVFIVLIALSLLVKAQSIIFNNISKDKKPVTDEEKIDDLSGIAQKDMGMSSGELKLIGVDEKTAAIIMAIVSDQSEIPLSELQFKTIKALD